MQDNLLQRYESVQYVYVKHWNQTVSRFHARTVWAVHSCFALYARARTVKPITCCVAVTRAIFSTILSKICRWTLWENYFKQDQYTYMYMYNTLTNRSEPFIRKVFDPKMVCFLYEFSCISSMCRYPVHVLLLIQINRNMYTFLTELACPSGGSTITNAI